MLTNEVDSILSGIVEGLGTQILANWGKDVLNNLPLQMHLKFLGSLRALQEIGGCNYADHTVGRGHRQTSIAIIKVEAVERSVRSLPGQIKRDSLRSLFLKLAIGEELGLINLLLVFIVDTDHQERAVLEGVGFDVKNLVFEGPEESVLVARLHHKDKLGSLVSYNDVGLDVGDLELLDLVDDATGFVRRPAPSTRGLWLVEDQGSF